MKMDRTEPVGESGFAAEIGTWLRASLEPGAALVADSRQVRAGDAFFAWPGQNVDGRDFIDAALAAGAGAVAGAAAGRAGRVSGPLLPQPVRAVAVRASNNTHNDRRMEIPGGATGAHSCVGEYRCPVVCAMAIMRAPWRVAREGRSWIGVNCCACPVPSC